MDVILDVDTGVDDALAIVLACRSEALTVRAITCVAGNTGVDQVVANTLQVLDALDAPDIPVARGMTRPLIEAPGPTREVHGRDGMADLGLAPSARRPVVDHAVELLRRVLLSATTPVTLICLAPLTNIAVLLRAYPDVAGALHRLLVVGGRGVGIALETPEYNLSHDPEAAAIVFTSGAPLTVYGLDVFGEVTVDAAVAAALSAAPDPAQQLAGRLVRHQLARFGTPAATIGDAGAVAAAIRPDGLTTALRSVRVELAGQSRGRLIFDPPEPRGLDLGSDQPGTLVGSGLVDVALRVDGLGYRELFLTTLRS